MARGGPETPQPNPRIAEAKQRLFGDEFFRSADPQIQLQMVLITAQNKLQQLLCNPREQLEIDAEVAVQQLMESTRFFISEHPKYEKGFVGDHMVLRERKQTPVA